VDLQGELVQGQWLEALKLSAAVFRNCGIESLKLRQRKVGMYGDAGNEALEPGKRCSIATAASFKMRKRFEAPGMTTY